MSVEKLKSSVKRSSISVDGLHVIKDRYKIHYFNYIILNKRILITLKFIVIQ